MRGSVRRTGGFYRSPGFGATVFGVMAFLALIPPARGQGAEQKTELAPYTIEGDAIPVPLNGYSGDAGRGRTLVTDRRKGLCLLCHSGPFVEERFQGNLAPSLAGAGSRWSEGQLRLRIVDSAKVAPKSLMPGYHRLDGLTRVGQGWQGKPLLSAQEVEDVVAFLVTLRE